MFHWSKGRMPRQALLLPEAPSSQPASRRWKSRAFNSRALSPEPSVFAPPQDQPGTDHGFN